MRDRLAQLRIGDARQLGAHLGRQRRVRRRGADLVTQRRTLRRVDVAHAKAQRLHLHPARAELLEDRLRQQRQLLRPGRARRAHHEDTAIQPHGLGARRDAAADGGLPVTGRDRRGLDGGRWAEARLPLEHEAQRLDGGGPGSALHRAGHGESTALGPPQAGPLADASRRAQSRSRTPPIMKPRHAPRPPHREPPPRRPPPREAVIEGPSEIVYGLRAGLAVLARRRDDILRVGYGRDAHRDVADLQRWAASRRVPCDELPDSDLERLAQSTHHEGLVIAARPRRWTSPAELADALLRNSGAAVALDRVRNPYNIGAILRSAAFFGVDAALLGAPAPHPALAPDAVRVAEGGAEHLALTRTTDLADTLARLRARGVRVVGADGAAPSRAIGFSFARPAILVLGHEREGMSDRVRAQCDAIVAIPGTGAVESLNVAVAAGVLIAELMRKKLGG
ncbi:MAG: RNA methyltransferase [Minicystis sp.]